MKRLIFLMTVVLGCMPFITLAENAFVDGMEDLPRPAETKQIDARNISFGNEETRYIEASLQSTALSFARIKTFYLETLGQLGWQFEGQMNGTLFFTRNAEELSIAQESESPLIVRLTLTEKK